MSKPKRQHFIPKSYLNNFAVSDDGEKYFVEAKFRSEPFSKDKLLSTKDICVDKNLYTLPNIGGDDKYALERFYAKEIDGIYPEVFELLTNPKVTFITEKQRAQILMTTMSLFFRTPKFLNYNERRLDIIIEHAINNHQTKEGRVQFDFREYKFDFHIDELDSIKTDLKIKNKLKFIQGHLDDWQKFTRFKINCGISVFRAYEDIDIITSDNPVIMHSIKSNQFTNIFDPYNIISVPLDNKHYLTIFPNTEESMTDRIFRGDRDKWFVLLLNSQIEENSEDWILGKPNSIHRHIEDQIKYNKRTADNFQSVKDMEERGRDWFELNKFIEATGGLNAQVAEKVKALRQKSIHKNDPEVRKIIVNLAKLGYLKD